MRKINGYTLFGSKACKEHLQTRIRAPRKHVQDVYRDEYFTNGGAGYDGYSSDRDILEAYGRRYGRLLQRHLPPAAAVLDVGSAGGFVAEGIRSRGFTVDCVEPNTTMAQVARQYPGMRVHNVEIESFHPETTFDAACFIRVLEHLVNPHDELRRILSYMRPGGLILIETWDLRSLPAALLGSCWHQYSPPSVTHWFSAQVVRSMLRSEKCELLEMGRPLKLIRVGRAISLLTEKARIAAGALDMLTKPLERIYLPYPPLDLRWFLFRKTTEVEKRSSQE